MNRFAVGFGIGVDLKGGDRSVADCCGGPGTAHWDGARCVFMEDLGVVRGLGVGTLSHAVGREAGPDLASP